MQGEEGRRHTASERRLQRLIVQTTDRLSLTHKHTRTAARRTDNRASPSTIPTAPTRRTPASARVRSATGWLCARTGGPSARLWRRGTGVCTYEEEDTRSRCFCDGRVLGGTGTSEQTQVHGGRKRTHIGRRAVQECEPPKQLLTSGSQLKRYVTRCGSEPAGAEGRRRWGRRGCEVVRPVGH